MAEYAKTSPSRQRVEAVSARAASRRPSSPALEGRLAESDLGTLHAALNRAPGVSAVAQLRHALSQSPRVSRLTKLAGVLQSGATVQRAVVAIDGASDDATAKAITMSCLSSLTTRKRIRTPEGGRAPTYFPAGNARGTTYGPGAAAVTFKALAGGVAQGGVKTDESIYVLGHGDGTTVAGLDATTMATQLGDSFAQMPDPHVYSGDIKLIACYSGSLIMDGQKIVDPKTKQPIDKTYAASLADMLTARKTAKFQPSGAEGIAGIAWVDELSGRPTGLDVPRREGERSESCRASVHRRVEIHTLVRCAAGAGPSETARAHGEDSGCRA